MGPTVGRRWLNELGLLQRTLALTQLLTAPVTMDSEALVVTCTSDKTIRKRCVQVCLPCVTLSFPAQQVAAA